MASALHYRFSAGSGPTAVLLHELGGTLESFAAVADQLGGRMQLLRYDRPGAGRSPARPDAPTLDDHADDLARLMAETGLRQPVHLVATAAGALVAVAFAMRWRPRVAGLVLCAPALGADPARQDVLEARARLAEDQGMAAIADATLALSYPAAYRQAGEAFARYRNDFLAQDPAAYAAMARLLARAQMGPALSALGLPCLLVAGADDVMRPPGAITALAACIPGAETAIVASGHLVPVQAPRETADLLAAFVARTPTPASGGPRHA